MRGASVFEGYFRQPGRTEVALDQFGWLHTGDIGELLPGGALRIIDRKKNIFKLSQGEYIAPERIERLLETCSLVAQAYVHGDSIQDHIVAIIVPDHEVLEKWWANQQPAVPFDLEAVCASTELFEAIAAQVEEMGRAQGLNRLE